MNRHIDPQSGSPRVGSQDPLPEAPLAQPESDYRERLDPTQFAVTRKAHTERAFTGQFWDHWEDGRYTCICCDTPLFLADHKFDAGCGWPSYDRAVDPERILERVDTSHGMVRVEILCRACHAHLGHVFPDGPTSTGLRYCVNSASLAFVPSADPLPDEGPTE